MADTNSIEIIAETPEYIPNPKAAKYTPFETLTNLKKKHPKISARHLGKLVGISSQAVLQMFSRHGIDYATGKVTAVDEYKINRADIIAVKQIECLNALSHGKLQKASARDLGILFGVMYDKERLERGQSTNNTSVFFHVVGEAPDLPEDD